MLLKQVAEALAIPPVSLLLLALAGLLIERRFRVPGRSLAFLGIIGALLLGTPIVSGTLLIALEQNLPLKTETDAPPQAIVILGGDLRREDEGGVTLSPGPLSLERLRTGAILYRQTHLPILITGGRQRPSEPSIAQVMGDSLERDFLVPVAWLENSAGDTWENAQFSAAILRAHGITSAYVVTQAWHMRRAVIAFAHTGIIVTAAPTRLDRIAGEGGMEFVPNVNSWLGAFYAVHEWVGCAWYALR